MKRNVEIVTGSEKKKFVRINDIRFQGKRSIDWRQREYLKDYVDSVFRGWKKYLYDILDIKKKRATLSAHNELTRHKTHFSLTKHNIDGAIL